MSQKIILIVFIVAMGSGIGLVMTNFVSGQEADDFTMYCAKLYSLQGDCPTNLCQLKCESQGEGKECQNSCVPKPCTAIDAQQCPAQYCSVMEDCSKNKICHYKMVGEPAKCGDASYAGQDVECCPGLVRRCGIEFLDGTCDMEGKNSVYNLPICIPCGNGICNQFENRCNCPEDCGTPPDIPLIPNL
jgi:hypothetical protein